jgi:hypothetical protein
MRVVVIRTDQTECLVWRHDIDEKRHGERDECTSSETLAGHVTTTITVMEMGKEFPPNGVEFSVKIEVEVEIEVEVVSWVG